MSMLRIGRVAMDLMLFSLVVLMLVGCAKDSSPTAASKHMDVDRVEIFYRSYSQLSPVRFSERDLQEATTKKIVLMDGNAISEISRRVALPCREAKDVANKDMDVYILIKKYYKGIDVGTWKASPFHFYDSLDGDVVCMLDLKSRNRIVAAIREESGK